MNDYTTLTRRGKVKRLHNLAQAALTLYPISFPRLTYHSFDTNLIYRVVDKSGQCYMLRLASPGWRTYEDLLTEAYWLEALYEESEIPAPRLFRAIDDSPVLQMTGAGIPQIWNATLTSWQPGRLLSSYLTESNLHKMGKLFAHLHLHTEYWKPPNGHVVHIFDGFLSRGEPDVLFAQSQLDAYSVSNLALLKRLHDQVAAEYASLDQQDLRIIHCDLWHANIKLFHGQLYPFDFEDTIWGFRLHDIAMAMLDLLRDVGDARYPNLLAAFRRGYEKHLDWPKGEMERLQIGRILWKINYVARFERQYLSDMVQRYSARLHHYDRHGTLVMDDK